MAKWHLVCFLWNDKQNLLTLKTHNYVNRKKK